MGDFFDKSSRKNCRLCQTNHCRHGWRSPSDPVFAALCEDHNTLFGFAQVILNGWTTSLQMQKYNRETFLAHSSWLVEISHVMNPPPATLDGLFTAVLHNGTTETFDLFLDAVASTGVPVWMTPTLVKRLFEKISKAVKIDALDEATKVLELALERIPCNNNLRVELFNGTLHVTRFTDKENVKNLMEAALKNYSNAPVADWHGLKKEKLEELKNWLETKNHIPTAASLNSFLQELEPNWMCPKPFREPEEWSAAWYSGEKWKEGMGGILSFVAEVSYKPSMIIEYLLQKNMKMCIVSNKPVHKVSMPQKTNRILSYRSPYTQLFSRISELGASEISRAAIILHNNLPHNHFSGFQEGPKEEVKTKLLVFAEQMFEQEKLGPLTLAATYIEDDNNPWVLYCTKSKRVFAEPLETIPQEKLMHFVWLSSPNSIVESPMAVKIALKNLVNVQEAQKIVNTIETILPTPRTGWTENLFELGPSPAATFALLKNENEIKNCVYEWKSGILNRDQKQANCIMGILFCLAGAKVDSLSQNGKRWTQFIKDACGKFTAEDLCVNDATGSLQMLCSALSMPGERNGQPLFSTHKFSATEMPTLALFSLFTTVFLSSHRGSLVNGLATATQIEQSLEVARKEHDYLDRALKKTPELEKPSLWFKKYRPEDHRLYPRHIRAALTTAFCAIRHVSKVNGIPDIPIELLLLIFKSAGNEVGVFGQIESLYENSIFGNDIIMNWVFMKSRVIRNGVACGSNWNMA